MVRKTPQGMTRGTRTRLATRGLRGFTYGVSGRTVARRLAANRKRIRTRLGTKTKTKTKQQKGIPLPNRSGSESAYKISLKNNGLLKKFANKVRPLTLTYNGGQYAQIQAGQQLVTLLGSIYDRGDMHNMINSATAQEFGTSVPSGYKNLQIYLKEGYAEYHMVNPSNGVIRVTLYDILPRRDAYQTLGGQAMTPDIAWSEGIIQQQQSILTNAPTQYDLGNRPYDSQLFNDYFKVKCVTHIDLAPGQVYWHRVNFKPHKFIDRDVVDSSSSAMTCFKGLTLYTMAVVTGQPIHDATSSITVAACKLEWVMNVSYHFSYISNNMTTSYATNTISTSAGLTFENMVTGATSAFGLV